MSIEEEITFTRKVKNKIVNMQVEKPVEEGYGISELYDAKHYDKLLDYMADIRKGSEKTQIELLRDWVDQSTNITLGEGKQDILDFKPRKVSLDHNVITHPGIALTNKNITGQDMTRFLYIMSGTGNTEAPTIHSDHIEGENARVSILDTGFFFASGTALFQGCVFPTSIPDAVVKTFGSATHADPATTGYTVFWVNRILDNSKFVRHEMNKTVYTHTHIVDRRSRLSE